jgi:hypothetical protein
LSRFFAKLLAAGNVMVRRTWPDKWRDEAPIFYLPKSEHGVREVPISGELVQALKRWKLSCPISKWDLVFPKKDGSPHDPKTVLRSGLYPVIRKAKVKKLDMHGAKTYFRVAAIVSRNTDHGSVQLFWTRRPANHASGLDTKNEDRLDFLPCWNDPERKTPTEDHGGHLVDTSEKQNLKTA